MKQETYDALIIGAGIAGCSTAYYLARDGLRVALLERGRLAGEASSAGAGMLTPGASADDALERDDPFFQLCLAALRFYEGLDAQLKWETGIDIELMDAPTLRPAFSEEEALRLQTMQRGRQGLMHGLLWLDGASARKLEPLLPTQVCGALLSPGERNVQVSRLTQAYAHGAALRSACLFEGRAARGLLRAGERVVGVQTADGPVYAPHVILASGAWLGEWQATPSVFPVKGQMLALRPQAGWFPRHTIYHHTRGYLLPKSDGSVYVGATVEKVGFKRDVTAAGLRALLSIVAELAPALQEAHFERAWAGLRPGSSDHLPLLGASRSAPGLWLAGGFFRDGILLGPFAGYLLAQAIQGKHLPSKLDLAAFDPDRYGDWLPEPGGREEE
ncbi:MAG TPA: glycine oxidase ThiO [Ktedonobacteraceae bacterium]|nr:glycine oxidase ThiO [Ktedonobacteraceae bacterium]